MTANLYFFIFTATSLFGLGVVLYLIRAIQAIKVNNAKAAHIAKAIRVGAMTFLKEEYRIIALVVAAMTVLLGFAVSALAAACFAAGSLLSMITGFIGMYAATDANVRTTMAAKDKGEHAAFQIAF